MFALVQQLFGGGQVENPFNLGGRDFSQIELKVISRIVDIILGNMRQVWSRFIDVQPEFLRTEMSLPGASIVGPSDAVITITYQISVDGTEGPMTLIIPDTTIQPIRHLLASPQAERSFADEGNKRNMHQFVSAVSTDVRVLLGTGTISVRELMALKSGDVLQLDTDARGFLPLVVQGIEKGWGKPVTSRGRFALSLHDSLGSSPAKGFQDEASIIEKIKQADLIGEKDVGSTSSAPQPPDGDRTSES
jgi:flagellar motor switch protein FliM